MGNEACLEKWRKDFSFTLVSPSDIHESIRLNIAINFNNYPLPFRVDTF